MPSAATYIWSWNFAIWIWSSTCRPWHAARVKWDWKRNWSRYTWVDLGRPHCLVFFWKLGNSTVYQVFFKRIFKFFSSTSNAIFKILPCAIPTMLVVLRLIHAWFGRLIDWLIDLFTKWFPLFVLHVSLNVCCRSWCTRFCRAWIFSMLSRWRIVTLSRRTCWWRRALLRLPTLDLARSCSSALPFPLRCVCFIWLCVSDSNQLRAAPFFGPSQCAASVHFKHFWPFVLYCTLF